MNPKNNFFIISFILVLAFSLRLYRIGNPIADWHSWRQADTASVTKEFVKKGINLFIPTYLDLSSVPSGQPNPHGYRMVEFPIYNALTALSFKILQSFWLNLNFDLFHRLISVVISLGSLTYLYLIVKHLSGQLTAYLTAFFFAVLPYNFYYSQSILPEIPLVFFTLASLFHLLKQLELQKISFLSIHYWLWLIFFTFSLLIKPYALIFLLPMAFLLFNFFKLKTLKIFPLYIFIFLSLTPFIAWRFWIQNFPSGIPAYLWLLNANNIRFKGSFFHWIFAERIGNLILGYWGLILFGFGLVYQKIKFSYFFYLSWLFGLGIYLTVFATGNVQHDYYQIILLPIISIFLAQGSVFLLELGKKNLMAYSLLFISIIFMLAFSWFEVRSYFNINHPEIVVAGNYVNIHTPTTAKIIAPYQGDTAFLYQTNRTGWPIGGEIKAKISQGAEYYLTTTLNDEANQLLKTCQPVIATDQFTLIDLKTCQW